VVREVNSETGRTRLDLALSDGTGPTQAKERSTVRLAGPGSTLLSDETGLTQAKEIDPKKYKSVTPGRPDETN
jgi:hypothetical protein